MRILITNDLQKTATLYRLCRRRFANRREFFHTFEMSCNPKDHRAVSVFRDATMADEKRSTVRVRVAAYSRKEHIAGHVAVVSEKLLYTSGATVFRKHV